MFNGPSGIGKLYIGSYFKTTYRLNIFETDSQSEFNNADELSNYIIDNNINIIVVGNRRGSEKLESIMALSERFDFIPIEFRKMI